MVNCGGAILRSGGTCVPRRSGFGTPTPNPLPLSGGGGFRAGAAPPPPAKGASLRLPPLNPPQAGGCPPAPSSRGGCPPAPLRTVCSARGSFPRSGGDFLAFFIFQKPASACEAKEAAVPETLSRCMVFRTKLHSPDASNSTVAVHLCTHTRGRDFLAFFISQ